MGRRSRQGAWYRRDATLRRRGQRWRQSFRRCRARGARRPWTNARGTSPDLSRDRFCDDYLNSPADADDWRASPARAKTLAGLPPAFVMTAGADPLRDEGDEYAERLKAAGVAVTFRTYPGQFHGFFTMGKLLHQANVAASDIGIWLKALN